MEMTDLQLSDDRLHRFTLLGDQEHYKGKKNQLGILAFSFAGRLASVRKQTCFLSAVIMNVLRRAVSTKKCRSLMLPSRLERY